MKKTILSLPLATSVCAATFLFGFSACEKKSTTSEISKPEGSTLQNGASTETPANNPEPVSQNPAAEIAIRNVTIPPESLINPQEVSNQIKNVKIEGSDLTFSSSGQDPYFSFPVVDSMPNGAVVKIDITLPKKQMIQLFYQRPGDSKYSEQNSLIIVKDGGRQTIEWKIEGPLNGRLRLDPGGSIGKYTIHKVEVIY
jgi:hypothetical protein